MKYFIFNILLLYKFLIIYEFPTITLITFLLGSFLDKFYAFKFKRF